MSESSEYSGERQVGKPNVRDLIVDRLGIDFKNPPKEIPLTFLNRIRHFKLARKLKSERVWGEYFADENSFFYRTGLSAKQELDVRIHESMHALFQEVNPDYFKTINSLCDHVANPANIIGLVHLLTQSTVKEKELKAVEAVKRARDIRGVCETISEGVALWGTVEVGSVSHNVTAWEHLDKIKEPNRSQSEERHYRGHAFVTLVVAYLTQRGIPKGEALVRLMVRPPLFPEDIVKGDQYAQENLI